MDYFLMTAPCGLDCFNCVFAQPEDDPEAAKTRDLYARVLGMPLDLMFCRGCRAQEGRLPMHKAIFGREEACPAHACSSGQGLDFCHECKDFPCDNLHPYSDRAGKVPHNLKVFNLCNIKRLGLEKWARERALLDREIYFNAWWKL